MTEPSEGALVLGSDYKALGIVRSLGRHGIPVWVLTDEHRVAAASRYARRVLEWPDDDGERVAFLLELERAHGLEGWALYPDGDDTAALLAQAHCTLSERYRVTVPPWEVLEWAYDKRKTYALAAQLGIAHPRTAYPRGRADVLAYDGPFPAILKPASRPTMNRFTVAKAWRADDLETLVARYDEACALIDPALIMIQELVAGDGGAQRSYAALCRDGEPIASLAARRWRQWPMDFGRASTYVETIDPGPIEEPARRVLEALRFDGIVEIEFKYDAREGRHKLLDINPRVWGWHTLGRRAGVDFPYLLWRHVRGETVAPVRARTGVRWVRALTDVPTALGEIRRGRLGPLAYLASLRPPIEFAVLALDDPLPALAELPDTLRLARRRGAPSPAQRAAPGAARALPR